MKRLLIFALSMFLCGFLTTNVQAQESTTEKLEELKSQLQFLKDKIKTNETQNADLLKQAEAIESKLKTGWTFGGDGLLSVSLTNLNNWYAAAAEKENQVGINGNVNLYADYKKDRLLWGNKAGFKLGYLRTRSGENDESPFVKSIDEILIASNADYLLNDKLSYNAGATFLSQFAVGKNDTLAQGTQGFISSAFAAPAYITLGTGIKYIPNSKFNIMYHPLSYKATIVREAASFDGTEYTIPANNPEIPTKRYGVDFGETVFHTIGSSIHIGYRDQFMKNINVASNLDYYFSYLSRGLTQGTGTFDAEGVEILEDADFLKDRSTLNWNTVVSFAFNKYISATLDYTLRYDYAEKADIQHRNFFGVGLTAQF